MLRMEIHQPDSLGRRRRGVRRVAPVDKERHQSIGRERLRVREPPRQHLAVAQLPPAGSHLSEGNSGGTRRGGSSLEVRAPRRPGDEARSDERIQAEPPRTRERWLLGIGTE